MFEREISKKDVRQALATGKTIEAYPEEVTEQLLEAAGEAVRNRVQVDVRELVPATV